MLDGPRIAASRRRSELDELIPLAHPLPLDHIDVEASVDPGDGVEADRRGGGDREDGSRDGGDDRMRGRALTVYDMVKGTDGVTIERVEPASKSGGRSGEWRRDE